jgi:hypothetical protein
LPFTFFFARLFLPWPRNFFFAFIMMSFMRLYELALLMYIIFLSLCIITYNKWVQFYVYIKIILSYHILFSNSSTLDSQILSSCVQFCFDSTRFLCILLFCWLVGLLLLYSLFEDFMTQFWGSFVNYVSLKIGFFVLSCHKNSKA